MEMHFCQFYDLAVSYACSQIVKSAFTKFLPFLAKCNTTPKSLCEILIHEIILVICIFIDKIKYTYCVEVFLIALINPLKLILQCCPYFIGVTFMLTSLS